MFVVLEMVGNTTTDRYNPLEGGSNGEIGPVLLRQLQCITKPLVLIKINHANVECRVQWRWLEYGLVVNEPAEAGLSHPDKYGHSSIIHHKVSWLDFDAQRVGDWVIFAEGNIEVRIRLVHHFISCQTLVDVRAFVSKTVVSHGDDDIVDGRQFGRFVSHLVDDSPGYV